MKIVCVCSQGQHRSRILAGLLTEQGHETRYGGIDEGAFNPLSQEDAEWAEVAIFARERHQKLFHERFGTKDKEIALDVTDNLKELPEIWRRLKINNLDKFYEEYTYPRLKEAFDGVTFK